MTTENVVTVGFELWDNRTRNVLQFDQLDEVIVALRGLVERNGAETVEGLSLDAVSEDGGTRMTLAEDGALLQVISATAGSAH